MEKYRRYVGMDHTIRERAEALIAIAHPKFRDELTQKAIEMGLIH